MILKKKVYTINLKKIGCFCVLFCILKPTGIEYFNTFLGNVLSFFKFTFAVLIFFIYIDYLFKRRKLPSEFLNLVLLMFVTNLFVTIYNEQSIINLVLYFQPILSIISLSEMYIIRNDSINITYLTTLKNVFLTYVVLNFISIIAFPTGYGTSHLFLLGGKNMLILYILPALFLVNIIYFITNKFKKTDFILIIPLMLLTMFEAHSATSTVAIFIYCLCMFFYYIKLTRYMIVNFFRQISGKLFFLVFILTSYLIIVKHIQNSFSFIIENVLEKQITFTGRTYIWDQVIYMIKSNPFGYGWNALVTNVQTILSWGEMYQEVGHAHNFILNFWYKGGIFVEFLYLYFLFSIVSRIDSFNKEFAFSFLFKLSVLTFFIISSFEAYPTNVGGLFLMLFLIYGISDFFYKKHKKILY